MARPHNTVCADAFHFCAIRKEPEWLSLAQTGDGKGTVRHKLRHFPLT